MYQKLTMEWRRKLNTTIKHDESVYTEPISMEGIPEELVKKMTEVCPLLQGRFANYPLKFFKDVVGLCDHGTLLENVTKETKITTAMVLENWSEGTTRNRYPWRLCTNSLHVLLFKKHYAKVYGGMPDNQSFSMKFLVGCVASLIHKLPVNWVEEAAAHRAHRVNGTGTATLKKLMELVAYREQLIGLVRLLGEVAVGPRWSDKMGAEELRLQELVRNLTTEHCRAKDTLEDVEACLNLQYTTMFTLDSKLVDAQYQWQAISDQAAELKLHNKFAESSAKLKETRVIITELAKIQAQQAELEVSIAHLEKVDVPKAKLLQFNCWQDLEIAKEDLKKVSMHNVVLRPKHVFPTYPLQQSIPPLFLAITKSEFCPCCPNRGFVARCAMVGPCGCFFHPPCLAALLHTGQHICPRCMAKIDGTYLAQFCIPLTMGGKAELESMASCLNSLEEVTPTIVNFSVSNRDGIGKFNATAVPTLVQMGYIPPFSMSTALQGHRATDLIEETPIHFDKETLEDAHLNMAIDEGVENIINSL